MQNSPFNALMMPSEIGAGIQKSFEDGQEQARKVNERRAIVTLSNNPENPDAMRALMAANPDLAMKYRSNQRDEAEYQDKKDFSAAMGEYAGGQASGPDLSFLGQAQTPKDQAFLKMMRIDPVKALKLKTSMRDDFVDRLKLERDTFDWAASRFAGVADEQSYQQARGELQQRLGDWGQAILNEVPANFPGVEALNQLRLRALDTKEQLTHFQRQANIDADNARADRNTDDLISDRAAHRSEMRRYHDMTDTTRRRGQDARGRGKTSGRENIRTVKTPEEARALPKGTKFRTPDGRVKVR